MLTDLAEYELSWLEELEDPVRASILRELNEVVERTQESLMVDLEMSALGVVSRLQPVGIGTPVPAKKRGGGRKKAVIVPLMPDTHPDFVGPPMPQLSVTWPEVTHTDTTKLAHRIGVELTMMPPCLFKTACSENDDIANGYATAVKAILRKKNVECNRIHRDMRAVEVTSKPMYNWGKVKTFYDQVSAAMRLTGLVPHVPEFISGGGHIHVGDVDADLVANMFRDIQNRPWLNWVFNDPDDQNTHSYAMDLEGVKSSLKRAAAICNVDPGLFSDELTSEGEAALLFYGDTKYVSPTWFPDDKSRMVRYHSTYETFEFRFFQAPDNWKEQEAQIRFVEAYMAWMKTTYPEGTNVEVRLDTVAKIKAMDEEFCRNQFISFMYTLGLPVSPYQRMLDENLPDWFSRGDRS